MIHATLVGIYLAFWAVIILGSMYLTGTWYPLLLLIFLINFTVDALNNGNEG
jgi:hypothetical protein